ncbi:single-stranded-DNA-specific exonuclease RecJ [Xanthomonas phage vB_XciM_LucasX]|nr:single-stranded-DNA-specific exonuclease RecJ [Xanthomonas phage vB_XciM_LucasX]
MSLKIEKRLVPPFESADWPSSVPPVIQRIYAARGVTKPESVEHVLSKMIHWKELGGIVEAAKLIAQAIRENWWITISGDYDCDGATGTSVAVRGLKLLGAQNVKFVVPNRFTHGYGLSPALVDDMDDRTQLVITVDSGTSNVDGVARANELGRKVVITDHHLQGERLPDAAAIVNPNVIGDPFPSKALAGVGVMFYVLLATRHVLRTSEVPGMPEPDLSSLLDLVALGTIADLVPLDQNNRILVAAGLRRIRSGKVSPGLRALIEKAGKDIYNLTATDFAFAVGPRLNAAGRMEDMTIGITALISEDPGQIEQYIDMLEDINDVRKERQQEMIADAERILANVQSVSGTGPADESADAGLTGDNGPRNLSSEGSGGKARRGVVLYDPSWHSGIVGLVASKVKESLYRPVIALAPAEPGSTELRGSARSVPGFHLRDALALVDTRHPKLMKKFGGHAMAAGLSLDITKVEKFTKAFEEVADELLTDDLLNAVVFTDGELPEGAFSYEFAQLIVACGPWGQGFPAPMFENEFVIDGEFCRVLNNKQTGKPAHLKLALIDPRDGAFVEGIQFNSEYLESIPHRARIVFELEPKVWNGRTSAQLMVRHITPL